jgi:malonyl-CoA/methylmalonyl-CoA synthetase
MNLINMFDLSFVGKKSYQALEYGEKKLTFGDIDCRSNKMAKLLITRGYVVGDRIAVYLENCIEIIDLFIACAKTGVIFVPINILYKEKEISHILRDAEPKDLIAKGNVPGDISCWQLDDIKKELECQDSSPVVVLTTGDSAAAIIYTSGTTGTSKGAILTHNNFIANSINLLSCWQIKENDRLLLVLPLFHVHALANGLVSWLIGGFRMRLLVRFENQKAADEFLYYKPTLFFGVPTVYIRLLELQEDLAKEIGSGMRLFVCGSAPLPPQVLDAFNEKFQHTILERYGMTETLMNISNPYTGERRAGSVGFPLPGISAKIVDKDGEIVLGAEEGEVYIKGPNVFAGYWKREEATAEAFKDGYFKTGDMAVISEDGYITLRGRKSDLIISGGFNIYPREIEEFLLEQEGVVEAAVVGIAHNTRGEIPVAYIVGNENYNADELAEKCRKTFASFKVPRSFIAIKKLPRTALGKVQKHLLPRP